VQKSKVSAERCTFCKFLQKSAHLSADFYINTISAERCTPFCRNLRFLQKFKISAKIAEICKKVCTFLQKYNFFRNTISAEMCAPFCRRCSFLQKGLHLFCCRNTKFLQIL
jgi:hypothetical protein